MSGEFRFETFVDVHSNIFNEYLSSVIAKLSKENEEYRAVQVEIESLYEKYPKVFGVFDTEKSAELTEEECAALIEAMELKNKLTDMEMQSVYFRGCYDSVGYLKKQEFYNGLTEEKGGISVKLMPFLHSQTEMLFLSGSCQIAQQS